MASEPFQAVQDLKLPILVGALGVAAAAGLAGVAAAAGFAAAVVAGFAAAVVGGGGRLGRRGERGHGQGGQRKAAAEKGRDQSMLQRIHARAILIQ